MSTSTVEPSRDSNSDQSRRPATAPALGVLVVENHAWLRSRLCSLLETEPGLRLAGLAETAEDAMWMVESEPVDVVVAGHRSRSRSGFWLCRELKRTASPPAVVICSAHPDGVLAACCVAAEADALVSRYDCDAELSVVLRRVGLGARLLPTVPPRAERCSTSASTLPSTPSSACCSPVSRRSTSRAACGSPTLSAPVDAPRQARDAPSDQRDALLIARRRSVTENRDACFQDDEFQFAFERALGASYRQGADVGEVLATAERITDGDADSWLHEWTATAGAVWVAAVRARRSGRRISALAHFRRAATYYATALYLISRSSEPDRRLAIWRRQRACWEQILDLSPVPGERVAIAYEGTALPAFFFPAAGHSRRRPSARGGQQWLLPGDLRDVGARGRRRGRARLSLADVRRPGAAGDAAGARIPFRPDWERVLTPVLDAMLARADVDPDRVAVVGVGQGGYWVARALAFEHRFAAAVVDPGIVDVATAWIDRLPSAMREQLNDHRQSAFDHEMHIAELFWPARTQSLRFHGEPYGHNGGSAFRLFLTVAAYHLGDEVDQIDTPLLITESEGEQLWPGQSRQLYDRLTGPKEIVTFTAREGASGHCEPLAQALREARIFDWLEKHLG